MTDRISRIFPFLLLAPAVLPLVYVGGMLYPYIVPKTLLLLTFCILSLAAFVYGAFLGRPFFYERLRAPAAWIPLALLFVEYAASFIGIDFRLSFWGLYERGDGLLTSTAIVIYFYLIIVSADRTFLERLIKAVALVSGAVAGIAVLQWVGTTVGTGAWFLPPTSGRIGGTFGNAAFLAGYLGISLFVTLVALRDAEGYWRKVYTCSAALSVIAIFLTATRGTIMALILVGIVALVYAIRTGDKKRKRRAAAVLAVVIAIAGVFVAFRTELSESRFEPVRRIASMSTSDDTVSSRLFVWEQVSREALTRPLTGYGAEHVARIFDKIYDPSKIIEQWFDRAHNTFLDYFVQYGAFGLVLYLSLLCAFALYALRLYRSEERGLMNYGFLFLLLILTYSLQNFFVFDTPSSLWLLYALFATLFALAHDVEATMIRKSPRLSYAGGGFLALLIIPFVLLPLYSNILLTRGYLFHLTDVKKANAYFEKGLAFSVYGDMEYGYTAYEMYTEHQAVQLSGEDRTAAYEYAFSLLSANFRKYPYDARTATYLGHVIDTAPPGVSVDDTFDELVLSRAIELSPLRAQAWYMTTNVWLRKANAFPEGSKERETYYRDAIKILETYAEKEPSLPVPRYILATLYYALGDKASAKKWADEALPLYKVADTAAARPAVKYYIAVSDWKNAARFLSDLAENNPADHDVLYDLAKVTYLAGDPAASLRIVEKLRENNPEIIATDRNFLKAITDYEQSKK